VAAVATAKVSASRIATEVTSSAELAADVTGSDVTTTGVAVGAAVLAGATVDLPTARVGGPWMNAAEGPTAVGVTPAAIEVTASVTAVEMAPATVEVTAAAVEVPSATEVTAPVSAKVTAPVPPTARVTTGESSARHERDCQPDDERYEPRLGALAEHGFYLSDKRNHARETRPPGQAVAACSGRT
jgi:peptidoglycan hydrolase-like protein with peptidoglycan-binding domain